MQNYVKFAEKESKLRQNYQKVRDYCHYARKNKGAAHSICHLKSNLPNEIPVVFHNSSSYDPHFVIKELANDFEGQFKCLDENKEKYKASSVTIKKQMTKIDNDGNENIETISYKIKFIGSMRFVATSLSKLVDNLAEEIHKIKCKDCGGFLEYESVKGDLIKCKCLSCGNDYSNKFDENLKKKSQNIFKFSKSDINKFILLLRKGVYYYEYMGDWEKFNKKLLEKEEL